LLAHGDDLQTMYCHLSEIQVETGDKIDAGGTIGLVGTTGMSTGPHLHFELRVDGVRCDPVYVLKDLEYA
jgi:murein DD-endopeptidase MepM/ murein hydrolase activator NlpD